jgi:hypothetical protein
MDIAAAISALGQAISFARTAVEARDDAKAKQAIMDISSHLFVVHEVATKLAIENQKLQAEAREIKQQQLDEERFALHEIEPGRFALRFEPRQAERTPVHYVCQACFAAGKKVVLRAEESAYAGHSLSCPVDALHDLPLRQAARFA